MSPFLPFVFAIISAFSGGLCVNPGDPCMRNSTDGSKPRPGFCKLLPECTEVWNDLIERNISPPPPCYKSKDSETQSYVCCLDKEGSKTTKPPTSTTSVPTRATSALSLTARKCLEYSEFVYMDVPNPVLLPGASEFTRSDKCVKSAEGLIVGGKEALVGEFPHMALIGYGRNKKKLKFYCGGSLINENYVLTAAHCMIVENPTYVLLGAHNRTVGNEDSQQLIPVYADGGAIPHPNFKAPFQYNDIALIRLQESAKLSPKVRPACLHDGAPYSQSALVVSGWGNTEDKVGTSSEVLMKVTLNESTLEVCRMAYKASASGLPDGIRGSQQICAGFAQGGKDSCQGDSGGPMQVYRSNPHCTYDIVGVVSFGIGCGEINTPGVYTRVSYYVDWITTIIWPDLA